MEGDGELLPEQLQHVAGEGLAAGGEAEERKAPGEHGARPESERRRDVAAPPDAAVEEHLDPVSNRVDDRRQRLQRRHHSVELPAAVIRDDDARRAVLRRENGVVRVEHALDDDRNRNRGGEPLEVAPVERRVDEREVLAGQTRRNGTLHRGQGSCGNVQPTRRSRSREPTTGRSTVRKTAEKPASSASAISSSVTPWSRKTYTWRKRSAPGAAAATSAAVAVENVDRQ